MAEAICSGGVSAIKSFSSSNALLPIPVVAGLVTHPALSSDLQVAILGVIDEAGSATLGDIVESVAHPQACTATLALVEAGFLEIEPVALVDANTRVTRRAFDEEAMAETLLRRCRARRCPPV